MVENRIPMTNEINPPGSLLFAVLSGCISSPVKGFAQAGSKTRLEVSAGGFETKEVKRDG